MYKVLRKFMDGENGKPWPQSQGGFVYGIGDTYPKEGFEPTPEHIQYLLGKGNRLGAPCIEAVEQKPIEPEAVPLGKMKKAELEALAASMELDIPQAANMKEIIALIEKAKAEKEGGGDGGNNEAGAAQTPPEPDGQQ